MNNVDAQKRAAAEAAVLEIEPGMIVGLGTGSTVAFALAALGVRVAGGLRVRAVGTSLRTEAIARANGIALIEFADPAGCPAIDLAIDGVDAIDPVFRAIKGGGGAMLREKIVAAAATRMIAIADASKRVARLGGVPVPVELLAFGQATVASAVVALGGAPTLRDAPNGTAALTDQGNPILDCCFTDIADPAALAAALSSIPGVLGHGLFVTEIDALYTGADDGATRTERDTKRG